VATSPYGQPAYGQPGYGQPGYGYAPPPKKKSKTGLIIGLVVLVLLAAGGAGAFFLLKPAQTGTGEKDPAAAVQDFLTAVYVNHDPTAAAKAVCAQSLDKNQLTDRINALKAADAKLTRPDYSWTRRR